MNNIWKDNINENNSFKLNHSPLYDIPLCFHKNFSFNKQYLEIEEQSYSIKNILSSHQSYESFLHQLPSPSKTRLSQRSSNDSNTIEPITLIDDNNDSTISLSSSLSDFTHSKTKNLKLMDKEILIKKLSSTHHRSNEKSPLNTNKPRKSKYQNKFSQITISQFIQDINTNIEASIDPPKSPIKPKSIELHNIFQSKCPRCGYNLITSPSISLNDKKLINSSFPTVPKCINEYFQFNSNSLLNKKCNHLNLFFQLNLFDSSLFQWQIFNSNQQENFFCRKNSLLSFDHQKSSIQLLINYIQSQRQYVPSKYSSWNILFPNYYPLKFSLKKSNSIEYLTIKNPYGRTGLFGQGLFEKFGPNRYIISLIITQQNNKKLILLTKNQFHKWELPKTKILNKKILYHILDIAYIDHPLNTDNAWLEVQIILIKNPKKYFHKKTWFSIEYLHKLNSIEHFDLDLIKFYI